MRRPKQTTPPTAYGQLADKLRTQIISGELKPGHRLPSESELSEYYDVGRGTAREATRVLASQGFLKIVRGATGGTFVSHPSAEDMSTSLQTGISLLASSDQMSVSELIEVRELLEVPAAQLAAQRRTPGELEWIRSVLKDHTNEAPTEVYQHNQDFHTRVISAAQNRLLTVVTRPVFGALDDSFINALSPSAFWKRVEHEHVEIFDRIEAGDAEGAGEATRAHLHYLRGAYDNVRRKSER